VVDVLHDVEVIHQRALAFIGEHRALGDRVGEHAIEVNQRGLRSRIDARQVGLDHGGAAGIDEIRCVRSRCIEIR